MGGKIRDSREARESMCGMKRIDAAGSFVWATRALLLGERTSGGFGGPWVDSVESGGLEMASSIERTGTPESEET